jgi:cobalt-zinc-cadmium resistance protein CzcA
MLSGIRRAEEKSDSILKGIELGSLAEMRPVVMACAAAGLGLLPGALSTEIGVQAQQPLARVVVGGMVTSPLAILFLLPLMASFLLKAKTREDEKPAP